MHIFLSHWSGDRWVARKLAEAIEGCGATTFLDCRDVDHGDDFEERIVEEAHRADELAVLLTPRALARHYVWMEIGGFWFLRKRVIIIRYGVDTELIATNERIPILIKRSISVELNEIDDYLERVRERCRVGGYEI